MKNQKNIFIAVAAGMAVCCAIYSCKFGGEKISSFGKTDANNIIDYNNSLVEMNDSHDKYIENVGDNIGRIQRGLKNPTSPFAFSGLMLPFERPYVRSMDDVDPLSPPDAFNKDDRNFFKTNAGTLKTTYEQVKKTYKSLQDYITAEDYKDDKGAKAYALIDSLKSLANKYYATEDLVMNKLNPIADDAERTILQDHPLRKWIFAMKDDMAAMQKINAMMDSASNNYKTSEAAIQTAYNALDSANKQHAAMPLPDKSQYAVKASYFSIFNNDVSNYIMELRKIMRNAAAANQLANNDASVLVNKKDAARNDYNIFVTTK